MEPVLAAVDLADWRTDDPYLVLKGLKLDPELMILVHDTLLGVSSLGAVPVHLFLRLDRHLTMALFDNASAAMVTVKRTDTERVWPRSASWCLVRPPAR